ncbi:hypothetical protein Airi02_054110 [Actinoallomurus iriomotensis]|uniref:Uncharacterized protein n=1 Tax=Actinoallomurus iriomotensis TaxID=478107 RepID=A0A9W6S833_9ACTN|nr:hypothetical protein Airi02_054110 [Actinoallomurus iriomotensis]
MHGPKLIYNERRLESVLCEYTYRHAIPPLVSASAVSGSDLRVTKR